MMRILSDSDPEADLIFAPSDILIITGTDGAWTILGELLQGTLHSGNKLRISNSIGQSTEGTIEGFEVHSTPDKVIMQVRLQAPIERSGPYVIAAEFEQA